MGFGTEILFMIALGGLLLGPKRLHAVLENVARAKAKFQEASRNLKSQLEVELEARHGDNRTDSSQELDGNH
jgi:Sec-independent protein translocase protein TatA